MARDALKRLLQGIVSLWILATLVFFLARVTGNPVDLLLPPTATGADRQYMIHQLGLDRPYPVQYVEFIGNALRGNLGNSIRYGRPAIGLYFERLPNTLSLVAFAVLFAILIAIPLGVLAGSNRGKPIDSLSRLLVIIGIAAPSFWVGLVLMQVFAVQLRILPSARMGDITHYILPGITLSLFMLAGMTRLLRSSIIEALDSDYIRLARIKGVSTRMVIWKHAFRNSLIPVLNFTGMYVALMVGGSILIETVFAWPGVGRLAYEAVLYRDYPLIQAVVLMSGALVVIVNFMVDVITSYVDPRIRYG